MENFVRKSDVLSKRTIFPLETPAKADSPLDALRISQSWHGRLDLDYMADLLGREPDDVKRELIESNLVFENPRTGGLETKEEYLSGKVREKLRQAQAAVADNPAFARNVEELQKVQPEAVAVRHITPKLGGGWVPPVLIESFLRKVGFGDVKISYMQIYEYWITLLAILAVCSVVGVGACFVVLACIVKYLFL